MQTIFFPNRDTLPGEGFNGPSLNGTAVLQSIDLQTEKLRKSKNHKTTTTAADETGEARNFVGCSNLIGQKPCDVSV